MTEAERVRTFTALTAILGTPTIDTEGAVWNARWRDVLFLDDYVSISSRFRGLRNEDPERWVMYAVVGYCVDVGMSYRIENW